jgi:hypothetical protein
MSHLLAPEVVAKIAAAGSHYNKRGIRLIGLSGRYPMASPSPRQLKKKTNGMNRNRGLIRGPGGTQSFGRSIA